MSYKTILVPLDGSELSELALPHARALAEQTGAQLILLRVSLFPTYDYIFVDPSLTASLRQTVEQTQAEERDYLRKVAGTLSANGLKVSAELREGDPAQIILNVAQASHADLLVMSTHGRGGLTRWLIGSVADKIVQHALIPVLLVRANPRVVESPATEQTIPARASG